MNNIVYKEEFICFKKKIAFMVYQETNKNLPSGTEIQENEIILFMVYQCIDYETCAKDPSDDVQLVGSIFIWIEIEPQPTGATILLVWSRKYN